jgi:hypothetical protein
MTMGTQGHVSQARKADLDPTMKNMPAITLWCAENLTLTWQMLFWLHAMQCGFLSGIDCFPF